MKSLLVGLLVLGMCPVSAQELPARLDKVIRSSAIPKDDLGLFVVDLAHVPQRMVFQLNAEKDFVPASITKLVTATAVLRRLGPSFRFQTTLWSEAPVKEGVLKGDLILKGGGDSGFVSETMWFLVNEFVRTGITKVEGNVVVDDFEFDSIRADPSRVKDRVDRAYDAPVGAMSFNWNSINVYVRAGEKGKPPHVYLDPVTNGYAVENKAKTVTGTDADISVAREGERIVVRGTMGVNSPETVAYKNVDDPVEWSGRNLIFFLGQRGITVTGKVVHGTRPSAARLLGKAESKPVRDHVADMMKFSNNYVAEMLTKALAAQNGNIPASLDKGMEIIRATLRDMGIADKNYGLINPSGLSRRNHMRPRDLAEILVQGFKHFPTFAELLASLPLAGTDGTLKNRMKGPPAQGWVRAKTGLLKGVVGLAGYAGHKDGSVKAFAFIYNGTGAKESSARGLFDRLATELVQ
ncbi:MAG: D-alanyl-D-alanine carboxypeptidase/D-alanyl-D-alanine-endopeptidase [Bdellovibrionales bacterium]